MNRLEEYKRKKEIKKLELPLIYVVYSDLEGVYSIEEHQVIEIKQKVGSKKYNDSTEWIPTHRYCIDMQPYEIDMCEGEISYTMVGYGSGIGDLWEWSYYCTLSKKDAEKYYEEEKVRIYGLYLKPPSIFIIEKGWVDPMENHIADGYNLFGYADTLEDAKEFCDKQGYFTPEDCYSIEFYKDKQMPKFRYTEISRI